MSVPVLASEQLVVSARPRFEVDGNEEARLGEDLLRLEATEDEEGMARLEAVFLNWGRAEESSPPGFMYFDGAVLELGREIVVHAGADDNEARIFKGIITAIEGCYPELRPPEVVVRAEDPLQWLRMRQRTRVYEGATDADIASRIASDHGLSADAGTEGPTHTELWQVNQSDLGFLRERARAVDARIDIDDNRLVFQPRRGADEPPIPLSRESELLRFNVCADLAHQRTEVRVHGYSVADKAGIHERAGAEAGSSEATGGGSTGPDVLAGVQGDAIEDLHLEAPVTSDEAAALAGALMRRRMRRFVCGRGVTSGTPRMRVGTKVDLVDLGAWFAGVYHVAQVRHAFDQVDGLRTYFVAERADLGV
jgi:phage protein D